MLENFIRKNPNKTPYISCKDFTVSRETFRLIKEENLELLVTEPQPKLEDLSKYYESKDYISHTDSSKTLIEKIYQIAKNYAINKKVKLVNSFVKNKEKNILDVGCGTGDFLIACKNNHWNITGVEPNKNAIEILNNKKLTASNFYHSIEEIESKNVFDVITLWHVLEHIPNLEYYIITLKELLKPNGILIIAVPNYKSYDAKKYKEFWAAYDVPRHLWHFSKTSIKKLFNIIEMKVEKVLPMKLDAFYVSLLSEKYKTGKSNLISAFFTGIKSNRKAKKSGEYSSLIYIIKNK